jgi:hypothetical protein
MKIKDYLLSALVILAFLATGAWLMANTEWRDDQVPTPAKGEALENPFYATQRLLRELGGTVVRRTNLDQMPPPRARLILDSFNWDMFPGRQQRMRAWVEQGGQLIIPGVMMGQKSLKSWLPVAEKVNDDDDKRAGSSSAPADAQVCRAPPPPPIKIEGVNCRKVTEPDTVPARYPGQRDYVACGGFGWSAYVPAKGRGQSLWQVDGPRGAEMIRMSYGQGTVTVINSPLPLFGNRLALLGDNPLLAAAALQAGRGAVFWFVTEESRAGLLAWLWTRGGVAIALALLALALWLWRGAVRFGPVAAAASADRRSMADQVRGTGRFLLAHGGAALHAAQLRALHEAAAPRLKRYAQLDPAGRVTAIAAAADLDRGALVRAMQVRPRAPPHVLTPDLELMELARRRLLSGAARAAPGAQRPSTGNPSFPSP